jgi:hypothetical protein
MRPDLLAGRQWNNLAAAWNTEGPNPGRRFQLWINGQKVRDANAIDIATGGSQARRHDYGALPDGSANLIRFGECEAPAARSVIREQGRIDYFDARGRLVRRQVINSRAESPPFANAAADGTIDDIHVYRSVDPQRFQMQFEDGRFYKEDDALFTSAPLALPAGSRIDRIDWTAYLPPDPDGSAGALPRIEVELVDSVGTVLAGPFRGASDPAETDAAGRLRTRLDLAVAGPIRYRIRMAGGLSASTRLSVPLLRSPVLDDVTITYRPAAGLTYLRWEEMP